MMKDKREKGGSSSSSGSTSSAVVVKEEPADPILNKNIGSVENKSTIKREDDSPGSSCTAKKENRTSSNGSNSSSVIGSTNTGSVPPTTDRKPPEGCNIETPAEDLLSNEDSPLGSTGGSCINVKTEDTGPDLNADNFGNMSGPLGTAPIGMANRTSQAPPDGVQPLPSNVINKQPSSMELQYMQQQSQIFVFSTTMANKGAEAVFQGHYNSIIAYHCATPGTKKYLEKHPLKMAQFNRQNPAQWLNNLAMMKNKGAMRGPGIGLQHKGPPNMGGFHGPDDLLHNDGDMPWDQNPHLADLDGIANGGTMLPDGSIDVPPLDGLVPGSPQGATGPMSAGPPRMGQSPVMSSSGPGSPSLSNLQPSLQGVKIPDEDLTPQQRQHRKEKLVTIYKMHQMLFPEQGISEAGIDGSTGPNESIQPKVPISTGGSMPPASGPMGPMQPMQGVQMRGGPSGMSAGLGSGPNHAGTNMGGRPMGPVSGPLGSGNGLMQGNMQMGPNGGSGNGQNPGGPGMGPINGGSMGPMDGPISSGMSDGSMGCSPMTMMGNNNMMGGPMGGMQGSMNNIPGMISGMGGGMCGPMIPGGMPPGMTNQKNALIGGPAGSHSVAAQVEWQKLQSQFFEERKVKGSDIGSPGNQGNGSGPGSVGRPSGRPGQGPRSQGPPPPYHQTPRSASVPIATQSPNPSSPNNPTSNLSLPSPRAGSALNSPADQSRPFPGSGIKHSTGIGSGHSPTSQDSPAGRPLNSNPGTPISSHLSPSASIKDLDFPPTSQQNSVDGLFGRTLQTLAQKGGSALNCPPTEPNLMPVPSPQQIQYLNTFEGQELTIQKQPNTSLKDNNMISPSLDSNFPVGSGNGSAADTRVSGSTTPLTPSLDPRFPIPQSPQTPGGTPTSTAQSAGPSPQGSQGSRTPNSEANKTPGEGPRFPPSSPGLGLPFPTTSTHSGSMKMGNFMDISPGKTVPGSTAGTEVTSVPTSYSCGRADNMPLNPNSSMSGGTKPSHFDPISSLAQMSQQLTSASSLNGQPGTPGGMMPFNTHPMMMGDMGDGMPNMNPMDGACSMSMGIGMQYSNMQNPQGMINTTSAMSISPKLGNPMGPNSHMGPFPGQMGPRMIQSPYNGANIQVKPGAPNTIQYRPARPQVGNSNPRGPPSLEFLQRYANPINNMEGKIPGPNMSYFSNCGPGPNMGMNPHMDGSMGDGPMGPMMGMPGPGGIMSQGMVMRGMRPQGPMMRIPHMGFNGPPNGDLMFQPGPNMPNPNMPGPQNPQLFVSGPKGSPMGMGAPDASQPLPPSMGQGNNFKSSQFVGPTTADPNYAQQFLNFQQQLYSTTSRSQLGQGMAPNQYFMPK